MHEVKCVVVSIASAFVCAAALPETASTETADKAISVIARTKATSATYALYSWNRITPPNRPSTEEWSAEFNDGPMHRVETPRDRLIANCIERSGTAYSVTQNQTFSGPGVAGVACGINTNKPILSALYIGRVIDPAGPADRVEVTDAENIRTYDVTSDGILIRTIFALNRPGRPVVLDVETAALMRTLPRQNMFDAASLSQSVVPEVYKKPPAISPNSQPAAVTDTADKMGSPELAGVRISASHEVLEKVRASAARAGWGSSHYDKKGRLVLTSPSNYQSGDFRRLLGGIDRFKRQIVGLQLLGPHGGTVDAEGFEHAERP